MNARPDRPSTYRRYRRRILGWGAAGVAAVFAIGAPIFVNRVEDDLEARAVEVLNDAGVGPVDAHFSGQDGELRCTKDGPVEIPDDVVDVIAALRGVSSIVVDESCTDAAAAGPSTGDEPNADDATVATAPSTARSATSEVSSTTLANPDLLADVVANDSQFSTFTGLLGDADLTELLAGDGPFTVFAPTNAAFEAMGPDAIGGLSLDVELLAAVLSHHIAPGMVLADDLTDGDLEMVDGTTISVDRSDGIVLATDQSTATVTEADLIASNGVVHAIDQVLLPESFSTDDGELGTVTVGFADGQLVMGGTVADDVQQAQLIAAAAALLDPANVVDELAVDAAASLPAATTDALSTVITAMTSNLVAASAEATDAKIAVTGTYATDADRDAFGAAVAGLDGVVVDTELTVRPVADTDAATLLEADLNRLVADQPILFDPSSTTISATSMPTIDRVAAAARRVSGVTIVIEGHTDTDGLAGSNQALSEGRARSVRDALVDRGITADTLSVVGYGGSDPILDAAGVEDKAASRRVEFVVAVPA